MLGPIGALLGFACLGRAAGWKSIRIATVCVVAVGYAASALFYDNQADVPPDLRVSGMDEISRNPGSVIFVLPAVWIVLLIGIATRRIRSSAAQTSEI
ncbi:MAG: hypothetical protein AVDCRST_MAG53-2910 [uncultured Solirubrobacteraceae bacterium]|uniref:Uncharacterized protein n=1 Tax=uncultured Solirubrobacteraceae bacterium TaxID=1162706 RepID=A0A6J4T4S8_9ACTN|nr:MAG: hypothetical protein AVDCRST_MAG53-2910 [uncultured Solirubrobacteraceae bacterium]